MTTARDLMNPVPHFVRGTESVTAAAARMTELGVGALPICGEDNRLHGMLTDRDIVRKVVARGVDPRTARVGDIAQGETVTIGADEDVAVLLRTMVDHKVRRLPVIDGHRLVGIISQADIATNIDEERVGDLVEAISSAP
jgi:CBS domain-containing protein